MTSQLSIQIDDFNFNKKDQNLLIENNCFRIKWKRKYYLVTSHNFLPIKNNILLGEEKLTICINCVWNELLILKEADSKKNKELYSEIKTFDKLSTKLPTIGSFVNINDKKVIVEEYCFSEIGFISGYPKAVYLKLTLNSSDDISIGSPIYCQQNKLQGIVSIISKKHIYCLPSYYLTKTFEKENSFKIPTVENPIDKINRNVVKKGMIFNPYLGAMIPVSSFLLLEDNRDYQVFTKKDDYIPMELNYRKISELPLLQNKRNLIFSSNSFYNLSTSSLYLMKLAYPKYIDKLYQYIKDNKKDIENIKFKIDKDYLKIII